MAAAQHDDDCLPVGERSAWAGVAPRPLPPTPQQVVFIERDPLLGGDLMDYFWAAVAEGELSERVLALTGEIITDLNSSNYTVWEWRWRCVQALGGMAVHAAAEQALTRSVATANPKNYQLWNYRRRLSLALGPPQAEEEMAFSAACLQHDAKNYHAWAHRQAVLLALPGAPAGAPAVGEGGAAAGTGAAGAGSAGEGGGGGAAAAERARSLWVAELAYTDRLLRQDVRNNSAWSQRLFVLHNAPVAAVGPPSEAYDREVDFTARTLRLAPHNESGWEALRALMGAHPGAPRRALAADPRPLGLCREVLAGTPGCAPALSLLGDVLLEAAALLRDAARLLGSDGGPTAAATGRALDAKAAQVAAAAAQRLAREALERQLAADPMKRPFLGAELAAVDAALAAGT